MVVKLKRAYEEPSTEDGIRILVDRLWPRGVTKEELRIDHWLKEIAPSNELRKWFNHEEDKFDEFKTKYKKELKQAQLKELLQLITESKKDVTLIYGAKNVEYNHAIVLKEMLEESKIE
ncbi:DUF488 domain-containing protein [Bacillus sp. FJAT-22090]|uniref:DUF488 domain-containing protein n=1 Tax=Bacillus sp. FJAT-22090 TaxID=1581038 RepID=UPI0011A28B69|nr:DUF488 domain-containing protein [Bacillus sp. FJAT-22090]